MSKFINEVTILGNVGKDPEVKTINNDTKVAQLTIATSVGGYKRQDGTDVPEKTTWHNVVLWRKLAEIVSQYVKKGDRILVRGSLENRMWEKDGQKHYVTEIVANDLVMLSAKKEGREDNSGYPPFPTSLDNAPF